MRFLSVLFLSILLSDLIDLKGYFNKANTFFNYTGDGQNMRNNSIRILLYNNIAAVVWVSISDILYVHSSSEGQGQFLSPQM